MKAAFKENRARIADINQRFVDNKVYNHYVDLFWPLANFEIFGDSSQDAHATFDKVYYNADTRQKRLLTATGGSASTTSNWWVRYPSTGNSFHEYYVTGSGGSNNNNANNAYGLSPDCIYFLVYLK